MAAYATIFPARAELTTRYGEDKLWQVERLGAHTWRGWLTDGGVVIVMTLPDGSVKVWEQEADKMYQNNQEARVRQKLRDWFGRGKVDHVLPVEPGVWRARLTDGGLAYATVEEDGSITIDEREVVC